MKLRNMNRAEIEIVLGWAAMEGWNPGLEDAAAFFAADPQGFFAAELDDELAAAISVVNHSDSFAFLGLYICRPEFRGRGIGFALWKHALAHAGARVVGLDGVPAQQANYRKSGFEMAGETLRFEGVVDPRQMAALRPATPADLPLLTGIEAAATGYRKDRFLAAWLTDSASRKTLLRDAGGGADAFVTIRRCGRGSKIGPLVAPDLETATGLFHAAAGLAGGGPLVIDVPGENAGLTSYCRSLGMECSFSTARMYRGAAPRTGSAMYTVATLELG